MKKILKLENLIYLTVLAIPSYLLKVSLFGLPSNVLEILIGLNVIIWVLFYAKAVDFKKLFLKYKKYIVSIALIFFGLSISVLINRSYAVGLGILKAWFFLPIIFVFIINSVIAKEKRKNIFSVYFLSAFLVASSSLVYYFFGWISYDLRLAGIFNSPNYLAMYLSPALFVAYYRIFPEAIKRHGVYILISSVIIIITIYLTYSYAAWLSLLLAFGIVLDLEKKLFKKISLILLLMIGLFFLQQGKSKFLDLVSLDSRSSFSSRIMIWQSAEKILADNWFWGIGAGNFQTKYLEYQKYFSPYLEWAVPHPHNLFLTWWLYSGIIGLIGFILLIFVWFRDILVGQKKSSLGLMGLGIMFYFLLHGLFDTTYFKNDLAIIFWLLFSLI
ncbi:MAG: O-antigen ligase family protein [Candidatus Moraniibacteriota bacterium]